MPTENATALTADPNLAMINLIDQDTHTDYNSPDGTSSDNEWVQIELLNVGLVHEVSITNPTNCCDDKRINIEVRVGDNEATRQQPNALLNNERCGMYDGPQKNGDVFVIQCQPPLEGKYATIQILDGSNTAINIAEAEFIGTSKGKTMSRKIYNFVLYKL